MPPSAPRQAEIEHLHPLPCQPLGNGRRKRLRRGAGIAPEHHFLSAERLGEPRPDPPRDAFVEVLAETPADIVGLETAQLSHGHRRPRNE